MLLAIDTGLRRFEAVGIQVEDLDLAGQQVRIRARAVGRASCSSARRWRATWTATCGPGAALPGALPALWLAQTGALTGDGVHHLVQRRGGLAGIESAVWPHLPRHSIAHAMKAAGNADEVRRYGASAAVERAKDAHRATSPGDRP